MVGSTYSMGQRTAAVARSLHALNRQRLNDKLKSAGIKAGSVILLQGGKSVMRHNTDHEPLFRQESYFHWTFGVCEPDFYGAIDIDNCKSFLFCPKLPAEYAVWMGEILSTEQIKNKYEVDEVHYIEEMKQVLQAKKPSTLLLLNGKNTDSGLHTVEAQFEGIDSFQLDRTSLHPAISECRVIKTDQELEIMRYVNGISSRAHIQLMKTIRSGMKEYELESIFLNQCYALGGCRYAAYSGIVASGTNSSVLHYGHAAVPNDKTIEDGDLCLIDMGAEYYCYTSDITCTFPINGKFTEDQKIIYEAALSANNAVEAAMKPGVQWTDMHRLAERCILEHLKKHDIVRGSVDDMVAAHLGAIFMPHGLGHFLGIDTHDVGGYPGDTKRIDEPGIRNLRANRELREGMVITVEPGCYLINILLDKALNEPQQSQFLNKERIEQLRNVGGVRIEDDVHVTATGVEVFTKVPRTVEEIEAVMASKN